ncbi:FRIGIDA-like protein 5 isoform X1 [Prunus yedoensis var. nudiflora]|uniref:FRIGIDA-like protein n=1 Tax=Prunus yedoensis var. nudiflora TaxID=2094558 RepID=A0A314Z2Q7_PRUYE|nr:FRIGIDA-like protein 5 isoform X1 [Prunus yedoensis var. nudiflora]
MSAALQTSSDPAKLVLDEIQTSFAQYWRKGDVGFDETFMFSNIPLEELMRVSRHVGPHLKEDAIKLALQWKAKMRADTQNSLESLGFLQFVATYGLLPTLNGDEIKKLLGMNYQHKQALELCLTLGFADKIPDFIQNLIERKQLFEAFRVICTFKVNDKFSSNEVVDHQIADLRAVIQCIKDYRLESEYPSKDIEIQIVQLEKMKENWIKMAKSLGSKAEQEKKSLGSKDEQGERSLAATQVEQEDKPLASKEKKPSTSTSVSKVEQEDKSLASQEKKPSTSNSVSKVEQEDKSLASQEKKCSSIISASKVEQEDKSLASQKKKCSTIIYASKAVQEEKKKKKRRTTTSASKADQEKKIEKKLSPGTSASKAEQEEKKEKKCSTSTSASKAEQEEKKEKKCSASTSASKVEQEEKKEKKRSTSTCASSSKFEQRQHSEYKRPRTSATPYALPTFPRGYLQPSSSLLPNGNYGHRGHF